ncbi:hypothetical protein D7X96_36895 [Corallococcus interemptor]|uniref:Uncharacterized protein n=1 Tax=Corallococcus interemptor TaxID=2316720 RepID=A0A3A8Q0T3_9BACT|nr:hypothetical protein [Corallococcus interemptor]RKH58432.1 hypothetical protein D7X96_36895 [Corallococcus interemptor]
MTRNDWRRRTLGLLLVGSAAAWGPGCKREQPQASVPPDAGVVAVDAAPVAKVAKPLKFSTVRLVKENGSHVEVTYTLTNPGTAQARGDACLALLDEKGFTVHEAQMGSITVKGGTEDVFKDRVYVREPDWEQTRTVLLYTARDYQCDKDRFQESSEPLRLLRTGSPAPADVPPPQRPRKPAPGEMELSGVTLSHDSTLGLYRLQYTVKNVSARRINGQACLQGYGEDAHPSEEKAALLSDDLDAFSIAAGATVTVTDLVDIFDRERWDEIVSLDLFLDARGCESKPESAPVRLRFDRPANLHDADATDEAYDSDDETAEVNEGDATDPAEDETGMDSSDAYDPDEEFPQKPSSDEETVD